MSGPSSPPSITQSRGSGPDDEPAAIRLGFCAEPIVDLRCLDAAPLYSECLARMLISESILLKGGDFVPISSTAATSPARAAVLRLVLDRYRMIPVPFSAATSRRNARRCPCLAGLYGRSRAAPGGEAPRPGGDRERAARRDRRRGGAAGTSKQAGWSGH